MVGILSAVVCTASMLLKTQTATKIVHNIYNQYVLIVKVIRIIQSRIANINIFKLNKENGT